MVDIISRLGSILVLVDTRTLRAKRKSEKRMVSKEKEELGMGNGKWGMGNGKWEMRNGKWEMGNGKLL